LILAKKTKKRKVEIVKNDKEEEDEILDLTV